MITTLLQGLVFITYIVFLYCDCKKTLPSISQSYYELPNSISYLFTLFTWGIGIPMLFQGDWFFFISGSGLCFVGAATNFLSKGAHTNIVHYVGMFLGIAGALFGLWIQYDILFPLIVFGGGTTLLLVLKQVENKIWWVEILALCNHYNWSTMEMSNIEILGWIATILIIVSFLFEGLKLRVLNTIGAVLWLYYGYLISSNSIMFLNGTLIVIQFIKMYQIQRRNV